MLVGWIENAEIVSDCQREPAGRRKRETAFCKNFNLMLIVISAVMGKKMLNKICSTTMIAAEDLGKKLQTQ